MRTRTSLFVFAAMFAALAVLVAAPPEGAAVLFPAPQPKGDGFKGIWYFNQPSEDEYKYKYSGGFATYPQQQGPVAYYAEQVDKTFFCFGGVAEDGGEELLHLVSYFDHATGEVARPTVLLNKKTEDAHDNPVMTIDEDGFLWIFSNSHGTSRTSYIHRSAEPYSIEAFEPVLETNFSYGHAWRVPGQGFLFAHTKYMDGGRSLFWMTSPDGRAWGEPRPLARFAKGHYQITEQHGERIATVFNYHPEPVGLNARTNLYYLETTDLGATWHTVDGEEVTTPVADRNTPALAYDHEREGLLVYLKTVQFDREGRPVIIYLTSKGYRAGPSSGPYTWRAARWTGEEWVTNPITESDHNYDFGSLYVEDDGTWRLIAPTDAGPQPFGSGGEMVMWTSADAGASWSRSKTLTAGSPRNHTYARRPVNAHPDFYALWADGDARKPSLSRLYFASRDGRVWRLPAEMTADMQKPTPVPTPKR